MSEKSTSNGPAEEPAKPAGGSMAPEVSRRVSSILDAVEQEAARLREDARKQAEAYLSDARRRADELVAERHGRIAELSDELVAKSEAILDGLEEAAPVRQSFENLVRALGDAADRLSEEAERTGSDFEPPEFGGEGGPAPPSEPNASTAQFSPPAPPAPPASAVGPGSQPLGPAPNQPDSVRTIAIQMAGAGWTRHDVGAHLEQSLGIADAEPILEEIFGAGSPDDARVPWTAYQR
jgi:hypothetical protein